MGIHAVDTRRSGSENVSIREQRRCVVNSVYKNDNKALFITIDFIEFLKYGKLSYSAFPLCFPS